MKEPQSTSPKLTLQHVMPAAQLSRLLLAALVMETAAQSPLQEIHDRRTGFSALVHVPQSHTAEPMPLLLYLHGAGESGSNVRELISEGATGTPPVELERGTALPALSRRLVMVAPQTDRGWDGDEVNQFLDFLGTGPDGLPKLDPKRCYVTGHSMGGAGALQAALSHRFAAVVPVAPAGAVSAARIKGVPVWAFHGKNDVVVPSYFSEQLVAELRRLGASESAARLTAYDNAPAPLGWPSYTGHGSPRLAYLEHDMWHWLLQQHL